MAKKQLLFIGLDAGDARLIDHWASEGWLPNIMRLKTEGLSWAPMETPADVFHVSAWPSIFTGTRPDVHGLYHAYVTVPGQQGLLRPRPDQSPVPFLWKLLSDRGLRSIVMDAFLTCPLRDFNGVQIVDWGSWSWFWDQTFLPASIGSQVRKKFGSYPFEDHSKIGMTPVSDFGGFRERLLAAVRKKTAVVKWLLETQDWDFFLVVFGESHPAGHYFWHLHDPAYLFQPPAADAFRDALRDVYVALDTAVGELVRHVGSGTTVMLVSGDGMGPNYSGSHLLDAVLVKLGALTTAGSVEAPAVPAEGAGTGRLDLMSTVRNMIPQRLRMMVSNALLSRQTQERLSIRWKTAGIAWPRTRAYVIENANEGYIRINLKGREPLGTVEPGREYERLRDELHEAARTLVNPRTARSAARAVYKTDEICRGRRRDHMPDVVIIWEPDAEITTELVIDHHGLVRGPSAGCQLPPHYSGNHAPRAFAIAVGPDVPRGAVRTGRSLLDLAPTILGEFGIQPPDYMPGSILEELRTVRAGTASTTE